MNWNLILIFVGVCIVIYYNTVLKKQEVREKEETFRVFEEAKKLPLSEESVKLYNDNELYAKLMKNLNRNATMKGIGLGLIIFPSFLIIMKLIFNI